MRQAIKKNQKPTEDNVDAQALDRAAAISSTGDRSLHIGNLNDKITEKDLREYFCSFGTISDVNMWCDEDYKYARNFAFIIFEAELTLERVLAQVDHVVQGQNLTVERAKPRNNRIFVSGLPPGTKKTQVLKYFEHFGPVLEIEAPNNRHGLAVRGYCFVSLYSERLTFEVLMVKKHIFKGKQIDVKRAVPRNIARKFKYSEQKQLQNENEFDEADIDIELERLCASIRSSNSSLDSFVSFPDSTDEL